MMNTIKLNKSKSRFSVEQKAERVVSSRKAYRQQQSSLSPEEKQRQKENRAYDKQQRENLKQEKLQKKEAKILAKREMVILKFMLKTDVHYFHHKTSDSLKSKIKKQIDVLKETGEAKQRDPYIWNYQGEGNNYMFRSQLGNLYSPGDTEFDVIHEVPLDGSYIFVVIDSGQRGLGAFDYIKPVKAETEVNVPYVNPGAFPPISY